jgi:hypothetical protein
MYKSKTYLPKSVPSSLFLCEVVAQSSLWKPELELWQPCEVFSTLNSPVQVTIKPVDFATKPLIQPPVFSDWFLVQAPSLPYLYYLPACNSVSLGAPLPTQAGILLHSFHTPEFLTLPSSDT